MKQTKAITIITFLLLGFGRLYAQENLITSGGTTTSANGTISYSIGQIAYTVAAGTSGSLVQGVQQPYEISVTLGINETTINLEMNVFPNPTTSFLNLKVDKQKIEGLSYQLIDLQGKVIKNKKISSNTTTIEMESLPAAIYFLKTTKNNQVIKTFKIIKK